MKSKDIPQGYKDSPLGIIPQEWEVKRLGEATKIHVGKDLKENCYSDFPTSEHKYEVYSNTVQEKGLYGYYNFVEYPQNAVTVVGRGVGLGTAFARDNEFGAIGRLLVLYSNHLYYRFLSEYINLRVNILVESAAIPQLTGEQIATYKVLIPPLGEQKKIAKILSVWDEAIERQAKMIDLLITRKRALMQRLLNPKPYWESVSYASILKEVKRQLKWNDEELYRLISVKRRSGGLFERESLYGRDIKTKNLRPVYEGDFLISKMQIVHGASGLTTHKFHNMKISGSYIALIAKNDNQLDMRYFNWYSNTSRFYHQTYISSFGVHIEKMTFDLDSFMALGMKLPPLSEQKSIAEKLSTADAEIDLARHRLDLLRTHKKGLMQHLLTGKKRVKI